MCSHQKWAILRYFYTNFMLVIIIFWRFLFDFILFCRFWIMSKNGQKCKKNGEKCWELKNRAKLSWTGPTLRMNRFISKTGSSNSTRFSIIRPPPLHSLSPRYPLLPHISPKPRTLRKPDPYFIPIFVPSLSLPGLSLRTSIRHSRCKRHDANQLPPSSTIHARCKSKGRDWSWARYIRELADAIEA